MPGTNRAAAFSLQIAKTNPTRRPQTNLSTERTQQLIENAAMEAGNEPIRNCFRAKDPWRPQKYFSTKRTQFPHLEIPLRNDLTSCYNWI